MDCRANWSKSTSRYDTVRKEGVRERESLERAGREGKREGGKGGGREGEGGRGRGKGEGGEGLSKLVQWDHSLK